VKFYTNQDWIAKKDFKLFHIESIENSADILAKALTAPAHRGLAHHLSGGLLPPKSSRQFHTGNNKNLADIFTKALAALTHHGLAHRPLGGISLP